MKNRQSSGNPIKRRIQLLANATALAAALVVALPQTARAATVTPPPMPDNIKVDPPYEAFLEGHAVGTQNYVCLPQGSGFAFKLFTPEATLFTDADKQIITHFFSPDGNPDPLENGKIRATWQHSKDSSIVWAQVLDGDASTDQHFVADGAVAWLKLTRAGSQDGPTGGDTLTPTKFVQRVNTSGGVAPKSGCSSLADVGRLAFMPYTADYIFYKLPEAPATEGNE